MRKHFGLLLVSVFFLGSLPLCADVTYTYVGNPFDTFPQASYGCPPVCNVTGSFTVAGPLLDDMPFTTITPLSFSISSGGVTLTDGVPADTGLSVSTDSFGNILTWSWVVAGPDVNPTARILTENIPGSIVADDVRLASAGAQPLPFVGARVGQISDDAGTWTATPEPSTWMLLGTGLLGIARAVRRKLI